MEALGNHTIKGVKRGFVLLVLCSFTILYFSGVLANDSAPGETDKSELYVSWLGTILEGKDIPGLTEQDFISFLDWYIASPQTKNRADLGPFAAGWFQSPLACSLCGDVNGNSTIGLPDLVMLTDYLFKGFSMTCSLQADVDDYDSITIRDLIWLLNYIFNKPGCGGWPLICPPNNPPLQPVVLPTDTLKISDVIIPAGDSSVAVNLEYKNADYVRAFVLPLKFRVGNQVPVIDSVTMDRFSGSVKIDTGSGKILFSYLPANHFGPGSDTMITVHLSVQPDSLGGLVTVDTTGFPPGHHPLFLDTLCMSPLLPKLVGFGSPHIDFKAYSPVDLHVIDPTVDSIGPDFNFIPGATYDTATDNVSIPQAEEGEYTIKVLRDPNAPPGDTTYTLTVQVDGGIEYVVVSDAPAPEGNQANTITVTYNNSRPFCYAIPGDANSSQDLSLADAISIVRYVFGGGLSWISYQLCRGDANGDGSPTLADAILVINAIFGKPPCDLPPIGSCILFNLGSGCCLPASF